MVTLVRNFGSGSKIFPVKDFQHKLRLLAPTTSFFKNFRTETNILLQSHPLRSSVRRGAENRDVFGYKSFRTVITMASNATLGLTKPSQPVLPEVEVALVESVTLSSDADILLIGVFEDFFGKEGEFTSSVDLQEIDNALNGLLSDLTKEEEFTGKVGKHVVARVPGKSFKRIALVGLGKIENAGVGGSWKAFGGIIASLAKQSKASSAAVSVIGASDLPIDSKKAALGGLTSGTILGLFEDVRFKSESKPPTLKSISVGGLSQEVEVAAEVDKAARVAAGTILTKQLVNAPPNVLTPNALAEVAVEIAAAHADVITATILDKDECEKLGMGAYLGVAAASENPPKFIHLKYSPPEGEVTKKLAIIGKGLTFDSGGYNIKAGAGSMIELMKFDMGGAGATLGAAKAIGAIQPQGIEVHFIVAACENMISGSGLRPGDILTASNGRTIEVNNTDAEGRLTLADALVYAGKLKVDKIVDLATLTGACIIALGNDIAGMFTPQDSLAEELTKASKTAGEKLWRLPLEESYNEMLKSNIADTVNTGGRPGGSITAALFLKEFVDPETPWAHLDIAGPVWSEKKGGGTGFAVATLVEWVLGH